MDDRRARLARTFRRYAEEAGKRVAIIRDLVAADLPEGSASMETVLLHAHTLAGSGETMGAVEVGTLGAKIESLLRGLPPGTLPDSKARESLMDLSARLEEAVRKFDPEAGLDRFLARAFATN